MKTIFMPKRLWKKWDKALRSGGYKQAKSILYDKKTCGFCCLGVLQHVIDRGNVEVDSSGHYLDLPSRLWMNEMGIRFKDSSGDRSSDPYLPPLDDYASSLNDGGEDFVSIANAISECVQFTDAKK